jgi:hypothetical protein
LSLTDHGLAFRRAIAVTVMVGLTILLASCAAGPNTAASAVPADQLAGFWPGLWHGLISPIAFIVSLFNPNVGIGRGACRRPAPGLQPVTARRVILLDSVSPFSHG